MGNALKPFSRGKRAGQFLAFGIFAAHPAIRMRIWQLSAETSLRWPGVFLPIQESANPGLRLFSFKQSERAGQFKSVPILCFIPSRFDAPLAFGERRTG